MMLGNANSEAMRNAIALLLASGGGGGGGGGASAPAPAFTPEEPYQYPVDPADPADYSSGLVPGGSALLGHLAPEGFAQSVNDQAVTDALGGLMQGHSPDANTGAKGTGLGLAQTGYSSDLGYAHAANMADQAMTALGIYDAIDTSHDVNAAVEEGGYTSPSPAPAPAYESPDPSSTIVGLPSDFTTSNVSMDTGPAGGFDAGAAIAADVAGLSGLNAGVNDAVAGYAADQGFGGFDAGPSGAPAGFDAGGSGEGGGGGGGGGGSK